MNEQIDICVKSTNYDDHKTLTDEFNVILNLSAQNLEKGGPYLFGKRVTIADFALISLVTSIVTNK